MSTETTDEFDKLPTSRVQRTDNGVDIECGIASADGYMRLKVEWSEEDHLWVALTDRHRGCVAIGETKQDALIELVRVYAALTDIYESREVELHRIINNSPDSLARELREAEKDLHTVQQVVCRRFPLPDDAAEANAITREALDPLWRAERALTAFAARVAVQAERATP